MKPINCCKGCKGINENGTFRNKLKCMFCDEYFQEETRRLYNEQKSDKGCSTCINCKHVHDYPGYVTAEENVCVAGLECDTVTFEVKNCPKWKGLYESEVAMECGTNLMYVDVRFNRIETMEFQKVHARIRDALKTFKGSKFRDAEMYESLSKLNDAMNEFEKKAMWNVD